jgi:hypothetical protein
MKKSLIAAASAFAVMLGGTSPSWAFLDDQNSTAVAATVLVQVKANTGTINTMNALAQLQANVLNNNIGANSFQNQVLNQNNINTGINAALQGSTTAAFAVNVNN